MLVRLKLLEGGCGIAQDGHQSAGLPHVALSGVSKSRQMAYLSELELPLGMTP